MHTQLKSLSPAKPGLELDLIADFTCPWSFLGKKRLEQALTSVYGAPVLALRWHGMRMRDAGVVAWPQYLESRLAPGSDAALAERALLEAGAALRVNFRFDLIRRVPDSLEAHRLMKLAAPEGRQSELADAVFEAYFERGRDIGDRAVLAEIGAELGLTSGVVAGFADTAQGRGEVTGEEQRLRSLGLSTTPSLLVNGHVLVPGPANADTYVQAIDQALFPQLAVPADRQALH